ncbi:MAG: ParB/RepB/Spo0J family partition protein [Rickettsiales bacterium]|nr:ParB/RepB/Spo0J family partition protein [Rickettsiales bacterium]
MKAEKKGPSKKIIRPSSAKSKNSNQKSKFKSPVYNIRAIPLEKLRANEYNPNRVAPPEMELLYDSIKQDGYTMPIVVYHHPEDDMYEIVDGFHRYTVMLRYPDIYRREGGLMPCSIIEKPIDERIASTIRHNRARGSHTVDLMSNIVAELSEMGKSDKWISTHLGMSMDEILRLKQVTGLAALFKNKEFSQSWTVG